MRTTNFLTWLKRLHADERGVAFEQIAWLGIAAAVMGFAVTVAFPKIQKYVIDGIDVLIHWKPY